MRLLGKKFIPGFRIEMNDEDEDEDQLIPPAGNGGLNVVHIESDILEAQQNPNPTEPYAANEPQELAVVTNNRPTNGNVLDPESSESSEPEDDSSSEDSDYETECYESYTRLRKKKEKNPEAQLEGTDWESVNYQMKKLACEEDEITGLDVSESYIVVQYYIEPAIDVYDRTLFTHLFRLNGHEYGGQCLKISECSALQTEQTEGEVSSHKSLLYSASMDCSLKSWNLEKQSLIDSVTDHCDYVQTLTIHKSENTDYVATGGRGDKAIFVYKISKEGKFNRLLKLQGHTGWVIQMIFIHGTKPDAIQQTQNTTGETNQHCPKYLLSGSEDGTIRLWDLSNKGAVRYNLEQDAGVSCMMLSQLKGYKNTLVLFGDRDGKMSYLDLGSPEILEHEEGCDKYATGCGTGLTGIVHTNEIADFEEPSAIHLLPNILIGTGKYCRSCKYHDKAVDTAYLSDNGYLITASAGSKFVKIWKINVPSTERNHSCDSSNSTNSRGDNVVNYELEKTEVRELQILRDYSDYLSIVCVFGNSIYSSCSDGHIYAHTFPELDKGTVHYDMAFDDEGTAASASAKTTLRKTKLFGSAEEDSSRQNQEVLLSTTNPEDSTEVCDGPRLCRTGKTGLVRSSSSFQVSFQLKPSICTINGQIKLPNSAASKPAAIQEEDEWEPESDSDIVDSDEYEIVYVSEEESEDDSS